MPKHIAIIMDGNGRWAKDRQRPRIFGHIKGARVAKKIITKSVEMGIRELTLYAFSTENWSRPEEEVNFLIRLLKRYLVRERNRLIKQNIRFKVIGDYHKFPNFVVEEIENTIELTRKNTGMCLSFALNYGGRQELVEVMKDLSLQVQLGKLNPNQITEELVTTFIKQKSVLDPDLIIRTSGELRLSNFLMWQSVYSELYFTSTLWPDFNEFHFLEAITAFENRERRFGHTSEQLSSLNSREGLL